MYVITGGGSGIGRALAHRLAASNLEVLIIGRVEKTLMETKSSYPDKIITLVADISVGSGRAHVERFLKERSVCALIHNAAVLNPLKPLLEVNVEEWQHAFATNVEGPLFLTKRLARLLQGKRVLHLSTAMAHMPTSGWGAYCATKSALFMIYEILKKERTGILFGSVMPGVTDTNMQALIRSSVTLEKAQIEFFMRLKENKQLILPDTVACFLDYLLHTVDDELFQSKEWDIYDVSHHRDWLGSAVLPQPFS